MKKKVFDSFRNLIYEKSGIALNENKEALITARISKRMKLLEITEDKEYLKCVLEDSTGEELRGLLDAMTTNVTHFFREPHHFVFIQNVIRKWQRAGVRKLRIWSAGCSSGEEPFSIAMSILDCIDSTGWDIKILATDLSTKILKRCLASVYDLDQNDQISNHQREAYFMRDRHTNAYTVRGKVREMITFRQLNLSHIPFPMKNAFNIIFCRNVMIYFDNEVRRALLEEFYRLLKPDGYLLVGHAESLTGLMSGFSVVEPSIYEKKQGIHSNQHVKRF
ncbi:MAG: protein-glutamate O-methyltransferase CheR [Chitinivibrionales bacterium]|nr:protein-glutamate O-methyltransferase CheR [Chitinivibrionales bacterium]